MGYDTSEICVPLFNNGDKFPLKSFPPQKNVSSIDLRSSHERTFTCLPTIDFLVTCIAKLNLTIQWLGTACDMLLALQTSSSTNVPIDVGNPCFPLCILRQGTAARDNFPTASTYPARDRPYSIVQAGVNMGASTVTLNADSSDRKTVQFNPNVPNVETAGGKVFRLTTLPAHCNNSSDNKETLFSNSERVRQ